MSQSRCLLYSPPPPRPAAHLHAQVLPAVDPGLEHRGIRREPSLQPVEQEQGSSDTWSKRAGELRRCALCPPDTRLTHRKLCIGRGAARVHLDVLVALAGGQVEGPHVPTVVHSHEISNKQEGVGQHAYCNLKDRQTSVPACPLPGPPGPVRPASSHPGLRRQSAGLTPITNLV